MKNIIKKVTAFAMAFTLLGAGTTAVKTISPKSDTTITASAASAGVYVTKYRVERYGLGSYENYAYRSISPEGTIEGGTYVYSDGLEAWGPDINSKYCIQYIRVSRNGHGFWLPKDSVRLA